MEVISIDGIEYIRAAQLAKRFKYTSDYIGQLCRAGKVDAKLVGRTWYVNPETLEGHQRTRHVKTSLAEKNPSHKVKISISRQDVEPVMRKETAKSLVQANKTPSNFLRRIEWKPLRYEADSADLLPPIGEAPQSTKVSVDLAESRKVHISGPSTATSLVTEALPEVYLAGSLKVSSLDDDFDKDLENIAISDDEAVFIESDPVVPDDKPVAAPVHLAQVKVKKGRALTKSSSATDPSYDVAIRQVEGKTLSFTPARIPRNTAAVEKESSQSWLPIVLTCVCGALCAGALACLDFEVVATSVNHSSSITFSPLSL